MFLNLMKADRLVITNAYLNLGLILITSFIVYSLILLLFRIVTFNEIQLIFRINNNIDNKGIN